MHKHFLIKILAKKKSCGKNPRNQHEQINGCGCKNLVQLKTITTNIYYEGSRYDNPVDAFLFEHKREAEKNRYVMIAFYKSVLKRCKAL